MWKIKSAEKLEDKIIIYYVSDEAIGYIKDTWYDIGLLKRIKSKKEYVKIQNLCFISAL